MFEKYVEIIKENGLTTAIIQEIISEHVLQKNKMLELYGRYQQEITETPIFNREFTEGGDNKVNNKLANDWFSEIVDTKTGYMFGTPVIFQLEKAADNYQKVLEQMEFFRKVNNLDDLNSEIGKFAAICGYDAMLAYIDNDGQERVKRIDPWEVIVISTGEITEPTYALRYYRKWDERYRVEFFDDIYVTSYEGSGPAELDLTEVDLRQHMFDFCPLWGVPNNAELMGDANKVLSLIDAYDRTMSDMNSEIEQFRLAYMLFLGYAPEAEDLRKMKENGALYIPDVDSGEDIKFLTKQLDVNFVNAMIDKLEKNITRFAKHVNFTDEAFGGNLSGVAMRYKLFALENKAKTMERKHEAAMRYMWKVVASAWAKKGLKLDYRQVDCKYNRNIVVDITAEATAASALMAVTSRRTALEQLTFITDVEDEMDRIEEEKQGALEAVDLDNPDLQEPEEPTEPEAKEQEPEGVGSNV